MTLNLDQIREQNVARANKWHGGSFKDWSLSDWAVAMAGEAGEVCDVIKKLNRIRDGLAGNKLTEAELNVELGKEIADTFLYLDLLAARANINMSYCIRQKFNEVSEREGFDQKL
jgi:NTP pyrophosphatase (non-canonical NTP hydrolase)